MSNEPQEESGGGSTTSPTIVYEEASGGIAPTDDGEPPLSDDHWLVMNVLYQHREGLLTVNAIDARLRDAEHVRAEGTLKQIMRDLQGWKLAERPGKGRKGARLTAAGRNLVERAAGAPKSSQV
jgi:hypothetical protein